MVKFACGIYDKILNTIGMLPPETGGIIGSKDGCVCRYFFDSDAKCDKISYCPSQTVESVIRNWFYDNIIFQGFIHSHLGRYTPTTADIMYTLQVFHWYNIQLCFQCTPQIGVVESAYESGNSRLYLWGIDSDGKTYHPIDYNIV